MRFSVREKEKERGKKKNEGFLVNILWIIATPNSAIDVRKQVVAAAC